MWIVAPTQTGKTEGLLNMILYSALNDPGPAMIVEPTQDLGKEIGKDRFGVMIETCDALKEIKDQDPDQSTNLKKTFSSMTVYIGWAGSPTSLASRPIRTVFFDETNKYPKFSGQEASPLALGKERTNTFIFTRKLIYASTPTTESGYITQGEMTCEARFRFHLVCPHCGFVQIPVFGHEGPGAGVKWEGRDLNLIERAAWYECGECGGKIQNEQKAELVRRGKWIDIVSGIEFRECMDFNKPRRIGFQFGRLISPWHSLGMVAREFLESKDYPEKLMNWTNSWMAEPWKEQEFKLDDSELMKRREEYGPKVPAAVGERDGAVIFMGGLLLTAGVDVQDDRLECEVVAWGDREESWSMDYRVFMGSPGFHAVWDDLDDYLTQEWETELGDTLRVVSVAVDTGGHFTKAVYEFVKPRQMRRVWAIKGSSTVGHAIISRPAKQASGISLFSVGVDSAKEILFTRLNRKTAGPGYCHFPMNYDEAYFKGLTAEKVVTTKDKHGFPVRVWEKTYPRNEPLDCRVYAMAALSILRPNWAALTKNVLEKHPIEALGPVQEAKEAEPLPEPSEEAQKPAKYGNPYMKHRRRGGYVGRWK
jgi:phage terminase large subunit GpA-like protein